MVLYVKKKKDYLYSKNREWIVLINTIVLSKYPTLKKYMDPRALSLYGYIYNICVYIYRESEKEMEGGGEEDEGRVRVTGGGTGFVGSWLIMRLLQLG